tara:strand:- start:171 stop:1412 length:1242 start_codon:yes stop_codon:yes gene_type:complete
MNLTRIQKDIIEFAIKNDQKQLSKEEINKFHMMATENIYFYENGDIETVGYYKIDTVNTNLLNELSKLEIITKDIIDHYKLFEYKTFKLSQNPNFKIEWFDIYPNEDWDYSALSKNICFDIKWVKDYPNKKWDFNQMGLNKNFSIEWLLQYPDENWNFFYIKSNINTKKNFNLSLIKDYPQFKWDARNNSSIKNNLYEPTYDDYDIRFYYHYPDEENDFKFISKSSKFNIEWVKYFPDKEWDFKNISQNPNFEIEWVKLYPDKEWDFTNISSSPNFKIEWIKLYPDKEWNFKNISSSSNFKIEWYELYPDKEWDFKKISRNSNFNSDLTYKYPYKSWDFEYIRSEKLDKCEYPLKKLKTNKFNIEHISFIDKYCFQNRQYVFNKILSKNPNLTVDWIKYYPHENWNYEYIMSK